MKRDSSRHSEKHWALKSFKEADLELKGRDPALFLSGCMVEGIELHLELEDREISLPGKIQELTLETFDLRVGAEVGPGITPPTVTRISLVKDGRLYRFDTRILVCSTDRDEYPGILTLTLPDCIHSSQVRRALRIPATWSSELKARIDLDGRTLKTDLLELSLGGFRARLNHASKKLLQPDDLVTAILEFRELRAELFAEVRGMHGENVRFSFPEINLDDLSEPPEDFRELLTALGRTWTRSKSASSKKKLDLSHFLPDVVWLMP